MINEITVCKIHAIVKFKCLIKQGDSGGPLTQNRKLVGIVSTGMAIDSGCNLIVSITSFLWAVLERV